MKRKCMMAAGTIALIMAVLAGCGNTKGTETQTSTPARENTSAGNEDPQNPNKTGKPDNQATDSVEGNKDAIPGSNNNTASDTSPETNDDIAQDASTSNDNNGTPDKIFIGGKVRSIAQDSFVISRTLMDESSDGSCVIVPEEGSAEEELVTIRVSASTVYEHWTIQGGGAGIEKKEAAFSEIQKDGGLEAEGYFDGEEFVAQRVIIEVYK